MIDGILMTCFIYYKIPSINTIKKYTFKSDGITVPVSQYRDRLYTLDHYSNYVELELTETRYGDMPVCKIVGDNID